MIKETFATKNSAINRIDPRLRVVFATVFSFMTAVSTQLPSLVAALIFCIFLVFLSGLKIMQILKRVKVLWGFLFLLWLILPVTFQGEALYNLGPVTFTGPGVMLSLMITLKSNIILLAFITIIATMDLATAGHSLAYLKVPEKMIQLLLLTYRYIFVIEQEYKRLIRAAKIRGFRPGTNRHTYKTYAYIIGIIFVRASQRAQRVHQAMKCRGFNGKFHCLHKFLISQRDYLWLAFMSLCIVGLVTIEWAGINGYL